MVLVHPHKHSYTSKYLMSYLSLDASMVNHGTRIRRKTRHGTADMGIDFEHFLDGIWLKKRRGNTLLDRQNDTFARLDADGR